MLWITNVRLTATEGEVPVPLIVLRMRNPRLPRRFAFAEVGRERVDLQRLRTKPRHERIA